MNLNNGERFWLCGLQTTMQATDENLHRLVSVSMVTDRGVCLGWRRVVGSRQSRPQYAPRVHFRVLFVCCAYVTASSISLELSTGIRTSCVRAHCRTWRGARHRFCCDAGTATVFFRGGGHHSTDQLTVAAASSVLREDSQHFTRSTGCAFGNRWRLNQETVTDWPMLRDI